MKKLLKILAIFTSINLFSQTQATNNYTSFFAPSAPIHIDELTSSPQYINSSKEEQRKALLKWRDELDAYGSAINPDYESKKQTLHNSIAERYPVIEEPASKSNYIEDLQAGKYDNRTPATDNSFFGRVYNDLSDIGRTWYAGNMESTYILSILSVILLYSIPFALKRTKNNYFFLLIIPATILGFITNRISYSAILSYIDKNPDLANILKPNSMLSLFFKEMSIGIIAVLVLSFSVKIVVSKLERLKSRDRLTKSNLKDISYKQNCFLVAFIYNHLVLNSVLFFVCIYQAFHLSTIQWHSPLFLLIFIYLFLYGIYSIKRTLKRKPSDWTFDVHVYLVIFPIGGLLIAIFNTVGIGIVCTAIGLICLYGFFYCLISSIIDSIKFIKKQFENKNSIEKNTMTLNNKKIIICSVSIIIILFLGYYLFFYDRYRIIEVGKYNEPVVVDKVTGEMVPLKEFEKYNKY